jgi:hypothetical protein
MIRRHLTGIAFLCGLALLLLSNGAAFAERRVALVVGNSQYKNPSLTLLNPKNDAEDIAAALRALDFDVILTVNASKRDFDTAMTQFARLSTNADAALFYYAGHALQYQGRNYLMPTDGELEDEISLRYQMVSLDDIRAAVERADGVKIVVLDACRNNPVVDNLRRKMLGDSRSIAATRGLARIDKALGMVVAYATAADEVAADGSGRNSPFTTAFLRRLQEPGLEIGTMFRRIAADVNERTGGRQRPETYVSLIGEYYLNQKDLPVWTAIKDSSDTVAFRNFIAKFPSSPRVSDAQYRLEMLERFARQGVAPAGASPPQSAAAPTDTQTKDLTRPQTTPQAPVQDKVAALAPEPKPAPPIASPSGSAPSASVTLEQDCKRDEQALARLRANPDREGILRLERELGCLRLRAQIIRLKESVVTAAVEPTREAEPRSNPLALQENQTAKPPAPTFDEAACKREQTLLVRLRANRNRDEVLRLERELTCGRLRSQVVRLRESVAAD